MLKILAAIFCISFGCFALFYPDTYFDLFYVRGQGLKPEAFEPNMALNCNRVFLGLLFFVMGAGLCCNALTLV